MKSTSFLWKNREKCGEGAGEKRRGDDTRTRRTGRYPTMFSIRHSYHFISFSFLTDDDCMRLETLDKKKVTNKMINQQ